MNWKAQAIAHVFDQIADLSEISGIEPHKSYAYRRAARNIRNVQGSFDRLLEEDGLQGIAGVGPALASKAREIICTGRCEHLERLTEKVPISILDLLQVEGLGLKTAALIHQTLGVSTLDELEGAAREGRLRQIPGMGARRELGILDSLQRKRDHGGMTLDWADGVAASLSESLASHEGIRDVFPVGSLRRRSETIGLLELLVVSQGDGSIEDLSLEELLWVREVRSTPSEARSSWPRLELVLESDEICLIHFVPPEAAGEAMVRLTGAPAHLERLEALGYRCGEVPGGASEEEIYLRLGLPPIAPELRELGDEVDAALEGTLPRLVNQGDLRGDLHCHTEWSDGAASIEDMVTAAQQRGWQYLAITDHSHSLPVVQGLDAAGLRKQAKEIRSVRKRHPGFCLLHGVEVEIGADGSLDLPDEVLLRLDVVVAAVHTGLRGSSEKTTHRLVRAAAHPAVDIIGHPTGRLLSSRHPETPDLEKLLQVCRDSGTAVEINSSPDRLDLPWRWVRRARELGVALVVNSDAHSRHGLGMIRYGVDCARKGWCSAGDLLNGSPASEIQKRFTSRL